MRLNGPFAIGVLFILSFGLFAFQNFSTVSPVSEPVARQILPMAMNIASDPPPAISKPVCTDDEKSVIYLRLPSHLGDGTRLVGTVTDAIEGYRLPVDMVVGQDRTIGDCRLPNSSTQGDIKICLPGKSGPYLNLAFVAIPAARRFEWSMPVTAFCEDDPNWSPAVVQAEAGDI